jgi:hypothetical protein
MVMSNYTTFPDAIVFPDGTIRLVSVDAKSWAYSNTDIKRNCTISTVPDYDAFEDSVPQLMSDDGLVVKYERQPVFHYRSKRNTSLKKSASTDALDDYDRHRARFEDMTVEEYRKQSQRMRAYGRFKADHYRRMQERDEKRKRQEVLQDEQADQ